MGQIKTNAIISLKPTADHSAKEGFFVKNSSGDAALVSVATDIPLGVILDGEDTSGRDSVAIAGGYSGTCHVKAGGAISKGNFLQLAADGTVIADDGATAGRVLVGRALEDAAADELCEAVIFVPVAK